jgi:hypothetical protein
VELWEAHGLFRSNTLLGRIDIPMSGLVNKCSVAGLFPVTNNRKLVGPSIEVNVKVMARLFSSMAALMRNTSKLRRPLEGERDGGGGGAGGMIDLSVCAKRSGRGGGARVFYQRSLLAAAGSGAG